MIPETLDEWSHEIIEDLLVKGYYESQYFDFKEQLPPPTDYKGKDRLRRACCAFANSLSGGFIVFGIKDDRTLKAKDRMIGINSKDFPEHFGNYPSQCTPSIDWSYKNPPLIDSNGKVIHIVQIQSSWRGPHCAIDNAKAVHFTKRTNKGDEDMTYEEIRGGFLGIYEKKIKLQLLVAELQSIRSVAQQLMMPDIQDTELGEKYSVLRFNTGLLDLILLDVYIILQSRPTLLSALHTIKNNTDAVNNRQSIFIPMVALPISNKRPRVIEYNTAIRQQCPLIIYYCVVALNELSTLSQ